MDNGGTSNSILDNISITIAEELTGETFNE